MPPLGSRPNRPRIQDRPRSAHIPPLWPLVVPQIVRAGPASPALPQRRRISTKTQGPPLRPLGSAARRCLDSSPRPRSMSALTSRMAPDAHDRSPHSCRRPPRPRHLVADRPLPLVSGDACARLAASARSRAAGWGCCGREQCQAAGRIAWWRWQRRVGGAAPSSSPSPRRSWPATGASVTTAGIVTTRRHSRNVKPL